jgi:hypothetical protein
MRSMDQAIEDRVGDGGVAQVVVPAVARELARMTVERLPSRSSSISSKSFASSSTITTAIAHIVA